MASIPAIFFAFNGFYSPVSLQSEMKEPKKNSLAMALGIAVVAFLYVAIAVSLMLCSKTGSVDKID
jgi:amino acid transporter